MTARVILDGPVDRENVNSGEFYSAPEDTRTDSDSWRRSHLVCNDATPRRLPPNEMEDEWRRTPGLEESLFLSGVNINRTYGTWKRIELVSKFNRSRAGRRCLRLSN